MKTDLTERGLETLIVEAMVGRVDLLEVPHVAGEADVPVAGGTGWLLGAAAHYDREFRVDLVQLRAFLEATQPKVAAAFSLATEGPTRRGFLARLDKELTRRGVVDVLRKGIEHQAHHVTLFYGTPSPGNATAVNLHAANRFSVTRQLAYSRDETRRALDLGLFINGLPVATFEVKNRFTGQRVDDAVLQYQRDRLPSEALFAPGRCVVHFAVDDREVRFCAELRGKDSWFLPFNQGFNDGAGNPPNAAGLATAYLWEKILTPTSLTDIVEHYAQMIEEKDERTGKKSTRPIFPRYHQLDGVRRLLADVDAHGVGRRYLIQHSAGSGKSNSIAWLTHQLVERVDQVIVVTDRRLLDRQLHATIKDFVQVGATLGHAARGADLRRFIEAGKKIVISTVQKFPVIVGELSRQRGRTFAVVIDEAHSSQGGKTAGAMSAVLADPQDVVNDALQKRMDERKLATNASYFAFTATPKNKTLELFGDALPPDAEGKVRHRPFHPYTMKQAIDEGFILDVLKSYTTIHSYYRLIKTAENDPVFEVRRARKKLRQRVEGDDHAIERKAEIMVEHFLDQVVAPRKVEGLARAMVVTGGVERAIQYFHAIQAQLVARQSPYRAIVAFAGEFEYQGLKVSEAMLNGFPGNDIAERIAQDPYRFLVCADKFQTGYDEPLMHTMYVDKALAGIKAVQTLSRLNRARRGKLDTFVLDFYNEATVIQEAFADYYRTTILSEETDANKLHDLKADLDGLGVYSQGEVEAFVTLFLNGAARDQLDPILDGCAAVYDQLDEDGQVKFKGSAKAFVRTYDFLGAILPYRRPEWEKLSILLSLLVLKLKSPKEEDLAPGILEAVDMDSYRAEKQVAVRLQLPDEDALIGPVPVEGGGHKPDPKYDQLSNILKTFNEQFGTHFEDAHRIVRRIRDDIAPKVATDTAYQNALKNTPQTARIEHDRALASAMLVLLKDDTEAYKQYVQNPAFKKFVADLVFELTRDRG